jgi:hypothetical protein
MTTPASRRLAFTCAALALAVAGAAHAGARQTTITGPHGKTATRSVTRDDGHVVDTTTGPNGATRTRTVDRSPGATDVTVDTATGKTATRDTTRSADGSTTTLTGRNGRTGTIVVHH